MKTCKGLMVMALVVIPMLSFSQTKSSNRFADINLGEMKKTFLKHLKKDELVDGRIDKIYLFNREDGVWLNDQKLVSELDLKYQKLFTEYNIGEGPDRAILISKDCTAVGDFTDNAFHGKAKGRLKVEYTSRPFGDQ